MKAPITASRAAQAKDACGPRLSLRAPTAGALTACPRAMTRKARPTPAAGAAD